MTMFMPVCFSVIFFFPMYFRISSSIGINFFDRIVPGTSSAIASAKHPRDFSGGSEPAIFFAHGVFVESEFGYNFLSKDPGLDS